MAPSALALVQEARDRFIPLIGTPAAADVGGFDAVEEDGWRRMDTAGAVILHCPFHILKRIIKDMFMVAHGT